MHVYIHIHIYIYIAHAAYFSIFESTKILYGAHKEGHHPIQVLMYIYMYICMYT
jgi:hypothetical protein